MEFKEQEISEYLHEMWDPLSPEQQKILSGQFSLHQYKKNEPIYFEGEKPTQLYCLLTGKVKIFRNGTMGGRSQIVRVITAVGYFGYRAYFSHGNFVTSATAFESSTICSIPMECIDKLVSENNRLARFFIRELATELGIADERTVSLTQKRIRGRLAESLLFLKENYGLEEDDSTLSIYLSREDLANLSNMTTSNAIRTLSSFASEKLIAIDGRKIKLMDLDKLTKISRIG